MAESIAPHGGELVSRYVPIREVGQFRKHVPCRSAIPISDADLSTLFRIADGSLSPLTGPMTQAETRQVLEEEVIVRYGRKFAWTIPIAFAVEESLAKTLQTGTTYPLKNSADIVVGTIELTDVYAWDKASFQAAGYSRTALDDPRTWLIGGTIHILPQAKNPLWEEFTRTPAEARKLFAGLGYDRIIAVPTHGLLHRKQETTLVTMLERLTRDGHVTGVVLHPQLGDTTLEEIQADRSRIANKEIGLSDSDKSLWKKIGTAIADRFHLIGLEMKTFSTGPRETVMRAICGQNHGFTDLCIDANHAEAAQRQFDHLRGELLIRPIAGTA